MNTKGVVKERKKGRRGKGSITVSSVRPQKLNLSPTARLPK